MATIRHRPVTNLSIETDLGVFQVAYSDKGLISLTLPKRKKTKRAQVRRDGNSLPSFIDSFVNELRDYALGKKTNFHVPIDYSTGTNFQKRVWRALKRIPYGKVHSYAQIAHKIGNPNAARAVGTACGSNLIPVVIPCHRVVTTDGRLGGYSAGIKWKSLLHDLERIKIGSL